MTIFACSVSRVRNSPPDIAFMETVGCALSFSASLISSVYLPKTLQVQSGPSFARSLLVHVQPTVGYISARSLDLRNLGTLDQTSLVCFIFLVLSEIICPVRSQSDHLERSDRLDLHADHLRMIFETVRYSVNRCCRYSLGISVADGTSGAR